MLPIRDDKRVIHRFLTVKDENWRITAGAIYRDTVRSPFGHISQTDSYGLTYILEGEAECEDTATGLIFTARAGMVLHRYPGRYVDLRFDSSKPWFGYSLGLPIPYYQALVDTGVLNLNRRTWEIGHSIELIQEIDELRADLEHSSESTRHEIACQMQQTVIKFWRHSRRVETDIPKPDILENARILLSDTSEEALSIPDVAAKIGIGYETFRKRFKSRFGHSPGAYRNQRRMETACDLLANTQMNISEISGRLSFSDLYLFSRHFKNYSGHSPSEFRRQLQNDA